MNIDCYCSCTFGTADAMIFVVFMCLFCVCRSVWTMSNSLDRMISGIPRLNLSQKLHMAAPPFLFPLVNVFPWTCPKQLVFPFVTVEMMHQNGWNQLFSAPLQFSKISSWWVQETFQKWIIGFLLSFALSYPLNVKLPKIANLYNLKQCQFNVSFVSVLSPIVLFFGP